MSLPKKIFVLLAGLLALMPHHLDALPEKTISDARADTSEPVLKCAPDEKEGYLAPGKFSGEVKKGMKIFISPGDYGESEIVIKEDMVQITGEPGSYVNGRILVRGKDCVVKNIWARSVKTNNNTIFIDSMMGRFVAEPGPKADIVLDNCCIGTSSVDSFRWNIVFRNCTFCSKESLFSIIGGRLEFTRCVLFSKDCIFRFSTSNKAKIIISDSLVYSMGQVGSDSEKKRVASKLEEMKKSKLPCNLTFRNSIQEKPIFEIEIGSENENGERDKPRNRDWKRWKPWDDYYVEPKNFIMQDDSPGKKEGYGAKFSAAGFPAIE